MHALNLSGPLEVAKSVLILQALQHAQDDLLQRRVTRAKAMLAGFQQHRHTVFPSRRSAHFQQPPNERVIGQNHQVVPGPGRCASFHGLSGSFQIRWKAFTDHLVQQRRHVNPEPFPDVHQVPVNIGVTPQRDLVSRHGSPP
jgi:hypothetical protein